MSRRSDEKHKIKQTRPLLVGCGALHSVLLMLSPQDLDAAPPFVHSPDKPKMIHYGMAAWFQTCLGLSGRCGAHLYDPDG